MYTIIAQNVKNSNPHSSRLKIVISKILKADKRRRPTYPYNKYKERLRKADKAMDKNKAFIRRIFLLSLISFLFGCASLFRRPKDPYHESFYEKTRLIMMDEEKKIYRSLPDAVSREEFIQEFWRMRDPDPTTEENENKIEFENRISFANEWFGNWKTFAGRSMGEGKEKDRGWKTDRGRVYIILGPPSMVNYGMGWGPMRLYNDNSFPYELWFYRQYDMYVYFGKNIPEFWKRDHADEKDRGEPYIREWDYEMMPSTQLIYAMEDAKQSLLNPDYRREFIRSLQLEAQYAEDAIILSIPTDRILFEEKEGSLFVQLNLKITVYKDGEKIDEFERTEAASYSEDEILDLIEIVIRTPYPVTEKGNYLFEVVVTDLNSVYGAKYRAVAKKELRKEFSREADPHPSRSARP
jgi:GWxTD domain-containing protein